MAQPLHIPPKPSESATFRRTLYELTMSRPFNQFFTALVVLNSATLIFPWNVEEEEEKNEFLYIVTALSAVLNMLFAVEVKIRNEAMLNVLFKDNPENVRLHGGRLLTKQTQPD